MEIASAGQAKVIAENLARNVLHLTASTAPNVLADEFVCGDGFWVFFRHPSVQLPADSKVRLTTFVVLNDGSEFVSYDFRENAAKWKGLLDALALKAAKRRSRPAPSRATN